MISEIVKQHINAQQLTLREMARALGVTHSTIINWRDGKTEPQTDYLVRLRAKSDWRSEFAEACLRVRMPEFFN